MLIMISNISSVNTRLIGALPAAFRNPTLSWDAPLAPCKRARIFIGRDRPPCAEPACLPKDFH